MQIFISVYASQMQMWISSTSLIYTWIRMVDKYGHFVGWKRKAQEGKGIERDIDMNR